MNEDLHELIEPGADPKACPDCGPIVATLSKRGPHIKATCPGCGRYLAFVRQRLSPEERAKWDRLKASKGRNGGGGW